MPNYGNPFNPNWNPPPGFSFYNPGGGGVEGGLYGNNNNLLNPYTGTAGTQQNPISLSWGPGSEHPYGSMQWIGGPFGWGKWEDFGPGVNRGDIAVGGRYGRLARTGWNPGLFQRLYGSARNLGGRFGRAGRDLFGGNTIRGGPFQGWTREAMDFWHQGPGESQMGYPQYSGQDPAAGYHSLYPTTWYQDPQMGWVPQAQLANPQASNTASDYFRSAFRPDMTPGSGGPTQRVVGAAVGSLSNVFIPGLGFVTGPLARMFVKALQGGGHTPGSGKYGMPQIMGGGRNAHAMGRYNPNFDYGGGGGGGGGAVGNRNWNPGQMFSGLPEGFREGNRFGGGAPTFEGPGFTGPSWQPGGSIFGQMPGIRGGALPGSFAGLGAGSSGNLGSFGDKIANASFKHTLFNMDNGRANAYSYMKYMSNNGFGSTAPWAKDMPSWKEYNKTWDDILRNGLPNGAAVGMPGLQALWMRNNPGAQAGTGGPTMADRRNAKSSAGPYGPNSRMMNAT